MTAHASSHPWLRGLRFGLLMGVLFDGLQGGLIEVATFEGMGFEVFVVDSGYHVLIEGPLGGAILTATHRWRAAPAPQLRTA